MAIDQADENADAPGSQVAGFTIEYRDLDDATAIAGSWTSERETANAIKASQNPNVMAYIGTFNSGAAKVAMPILNRRLVDDQSGEHRGRAHQTRSSRSA